MWWVGEQPSEGAGGFVRVWSWGGQKEEPPEQGAPGVIVSENQVTDRNRSPKGEGALPGT